MRRVRLSLLFGLIHNGPLSLSRLFEYPPALGCKFDSYCADSDKSVEKIDEEKKGSRDRREPFFREGVAFGEMLRLPKQRDGRWPTEIKTYDLIRIVDVLDHRIHLTAKRHPPSRQRPDSRGGKGMTAPSERSGDDR